MKQWSNGYGNELDRFWKNHVLWNNNTLHNVCGNNDIINCNISDNDNKNLK